jgi:adenine deaminase
MDFPGVIAGDDGVLAKLRAAGGRVKDGHAPGLCGKALNAYLTALIGSDHEATTYDEGLEKLRRGMFLMIREGSAEKNLEALLPLVNDSTYHRCMLVVDDRNAKDLHSDGDVDAVVRKAVGLGLDPIRAVQMTTVNPARYFGLEGLGAIAPGYWANLLVLEDLKAFRVEQAYYRGRLVAQEGRPLFGVGAGEPPSLAHTVNIRPFSSSDLVLRSSKDTLPVIEIVPGQIVTRRTDERVQVRDGIVVPDPSRDLLRLVVVERHHATGNIGVALVRGFGLKRGALASSVAHDAHNVVAVGVSDEEIYAAVKEVEREQGGLAVVGGGKTLASLPLPIAGLLSREPLETVVGKLEELEGAARGLGCSVDSPFSVLSFLALPVIPELKLTDRGLVDVMQGRLLSWHSGT